MEELFSVLPSLDVSGATPTPAASPGYTPTPSYGQPAAPVTPAGTPASRPAPQAPDPELMATNPAEYHRQMLEYNRLMTAAAVAQATSQFGEPLVQGNAQTARHLSSIDPEYSEVWRRWGYEIDAEMAKVPPVKRTKANYDTVAQMVRGRHWRELLQDANPNPQTVGNPSVSGQNVGAPAPQNPAEQSPLDRLFAEGGQFVKRLENAGLTKAKIREQIQKMGSTEQAWVESVNRGGVIFSEHKAAGGTRQTAHGTVS